MSIKLTLDITSPLTLDDHELLSGCAVMVLAIANHELAKAKFPEAFTDDDESETPVREIPEEPVAPPAPCGLTDDQGHVCVAKAGHRGRHAWREVAPPAFPN